MFNSVIHWSITLIIIQGRPEVPFTNTFSSLSCRQYGPVLSPLLQRFCYLFPPWYMEPIPRTVQSYLCTNEEQGHRGEGQSYRVTKCMCWQRSEAASSHNVQVRLCGKRIWPHLQPNESLTENNNKPGLALGKINKNTNLSNILGLPNIYLNSLDTKLCMQSMTVAEISTALFVHCTNSLASLKKGNEGLDASAQ